MCTQVLEHLEDPQAALCEIARVVRPRTEVIISAPQAWELHEDPRDFWRFTKYGLKMLLTRAGFEVVSMTPTTGAIATAGQILITSIGRAQRRTRLVTAIARLATWWDRRLLDPQHPLDYVIRARTP